jgi:hypothetical protein
MIDHVGARYLDQAPLCGFLYALDLPRRLHVI